MAPSGREVRQVSHPARGVDDREPDWSPDGKGIAFERRTPCPPEGPKKGIEGTCDLLHTANGDGTGLRTPIPCSFDAQASFPGSCVGVSEPTWSPDGSKIAFQYNLVNPADTECLNVDSGIWTADADGTDLRQVTERTPGTAWDFGPQWSPDGKKLVIYR